MIIAIQYECLSTLSKTRKLESTKNWMLKCIIKNWWIEMLFKMDKYFLAFLITDIFPLSVQMQYTLSVDPSGWGMDVVLTCYLKSSFPHEWKVSNGRAHWLETDANPERCVGEGLHSCTCTLGILTVTNVENFFAWRCWYFHEHVRCCTHSNSKEFLMSTSDSLVVFNHWTGSWTASLDWTSTVGDWTNILY